MILIADSGLTKTDWRLIDSKRNIYQFNTIGFNPYFQDAKTIALEISENLLPKIKLHSLESINCADMHVYYYGAGCSNEEKCELVQNALHQIFPQARIAVEHNLLAVARVLCGKNKGIAAILDTGSNSCYYDGVKIEKNNTSWGYVLGDEGSAAYLGKLFIQDYLNNEMPQKIATDFYKTYKLNKESIFDAVYRKPMPGIFLASFNKFIYQNQYEKYINDLIVFCFNQFFDKHICKYPKHRDVKMNCVGSVAYYYSNLLKSVAEDRSVKIDRIIEAPISGLTLYHLQEESVLYTPARNKITLFNESISPE
ncbi:MAG: hypothetical protein ACT4ON_02525, partial [Bacteroidota bacterium]